MRIAAVIALVLASGVFAQQPSKPEIPRPPRLEQAAPLPVLKLYVLQGKDAFNDIRTPTFQSVTVEVRDPNELPVEGAEVVFQLPDSGPGGSFSGGRSSITAQTNSYGQATVTYTPNRISGRFQIQVTATKANRVGNVTIAQRNATSAPPRRQVGMGHKLTHGKYLALILGAAAGGTAAGVLATRGGSSAAEIPVLVLSPGSPSFGGPR